MRLHDIQQGSVLSPTRLFTELKENKAGISICNLYCGVAAHADDVRAIASSTQGTKDQDKMIANFTTKNGVSLNESKTKIVLFSRKPSQHTSAINPMNSTVPIIPEAKCLGYLWHKPLSARVSSHFVNSHFVNSHLVKLKLADNSLPFAV